MRLVCFFGFWSWEEKLGGACWCVCVCLAVLGCFFDVLGVFLVSLKHFWSR